MFCQSPSLLVVRFDLNPDGTAAITTIFSTIDTSGRVKPQSTTSRSVDSIEVNHFLRSVEYADFWSMPEIKNENSALPKYDAGSSRWVFEGVRDGGYHVVFRQGPEANRFTEMAQVLARDLAKLTGSAIPRAVPQH